MFTSPCGEGWWLVWQKTLASPFVTCVDLHVRASFSTNLKFVDSMNFLSSLAFKNGCKPLQATCWKHLEFAIYGFQRRRPWPAGIAPAKCYTATHAYSCKHMTHTRSQYDPICSKAVLFMTNLCLEVFGLHKWPHDRLDSLMPFLWPVTSLFPTCWPSLSSKPPWLLKTARSTWWCSNPSDLANTLEYLL